MLPTYCDLEHEEGEEGDGGGGGSEAGHCERDGHDQEAPPEHQQVGESSVVEPGGDLGAEHDADHEGGEDEAEGEAGAVLQQDGGPEEHEDVHGGISRGLDQSQLENTPRAQDGLQTLAVGGCQVLPWTQIYLYSAIRSVKSKCPFKKYASEE